MPGLLRKNSLLVGLCFLVTGLGFSQSLNDWDLVTAKEFTNEVYEKKRQVTYLFANKNAFVKYNPVSLVFGGLLFFYQKSISKQIGAACPYDVNCSNFSKTCIQKYGFFKGIPLTADRLTRCTRAAMMDLTDGVDYSSRKMKIFDNPNDYCKKTK